MKFADAEGLAFMAGTRSKLTVIDIDAPDEDLLKGMIKQYGDTPIILRSGSGNFQLWDRHGGEGRRIRPQADRTFARWGWKACARCSPTRRTMPD